MKKMITKKFNLIVATVAFMTVFAIFGAAFAFGGANKTAANVAYAEEEETIEFLETKAKVSLDGKYLLLVTGFDSTPLDAGKYYYIGYKFNVNGETFDTARNGEQSATYYASVTLRTSLEDPTMTSVVTAKEIYGNDYASYKLIIYEIAFETTFANEKESYTDIYAYIDELEKVDEEYVLVGGYEGQKYIDKYNVVNGDFEFGDKGWTVDGEIGGVVTTGTYWGGVAFNQHGNSLFSAYTVMKGTSAQSGNEGATGTLTSSTFTLGGSGWITYRLGGGKNYDQVYLEVLEKATNAVLARYYNSEWTGANDQGCALNKYRADLSDYLGRELYIRVTDNATNEFGLFFLDDVVTFNAQVPTDGTEAVNILYNAVNGSFDKDLYGWKVAGDFGVITENATFWNENYDINNSGKYFRGDLEGKEGGTGTLTSADFVVAGSGFVTFKLGAAGNENCYITLEKKTNEGYETVALWHNDLWADGAGNEQMPGYGLRMVEYKADLSDYLGETMRIVLHDEATVAFGFFTFDEFKTYYENVPSGTLIQDQLAARAAFLTALEAEDINAQGDYTDESYAAYTDAMTAAQNLGAHCKIAAFADALAEIETAKANLTVRVPEATSATRSLSLVPAGTQAMTIATYVDTKELSSITYEVASSDTTVATVSATASGAFTVTAVADGSATVTLTVKYDGTAVLNVEFAVEVTTVPYLVENAVEESIDVYELQNKTDYALDFTANVENPADKSLTYSATMKVGSGEATAITLTDGGYTYEFTGGENDVATVVTFAVTVAYENKGTKYINYNYVLNITDSTDYRLANGDFERGDLTGWTLSNAALGSVINNSKYWKEGLNFNNEGYFFSAYTNINGDGYAESGNEGAKGTLTSSTFKVGGSGYITYKLGAAKNSFAVWVEVVASGDDTVLARYYNNRWGEEGCNDCTLVPYMLNLTTFRNETVYLRVVDTAKGDYGLFFLDEVKTYYATAPTGFNLAQPITDNIYQLYNGGFELGDKGWKLETTRRAADKDFGYVCISEDGAKWGDNAPYYNEGNFLINYEEGSTGYAESSAFKVGGSGWMTFRLGGNKVGSYVDVLDAYTDELLARFINEEYTVGNWPSIGWEMHKYKVNLISCGIEADRLVRIKIVDEAIREYGVIVADSFVTYYANAEALPAGHTEIQHDYKYEVVNGDFNVGTYNGWTLSNERLGNVNDNGNYWGGNMGNEGCFFNAYAVDDEGARGVMTSSTFVIGGSGYITYKLGGAKNGWGRAQKDGADNYVYLDIVDAATGNILGRYYNNIFTNENDCKCDLIPYTVNLSAYMDKTVYIRIVDNAFADYGLFFLDSVTTYYANSPSTGFNLAVRVTEKVPANIALGDWLE